MFSDPPVTKLQKWSHVLFSWAITSSQSERLFNKSIWIQSITSLEYLLTDGSLYTKRERQSPWHFTRQKAYHIHVFLLSLLYVVWTSQGIFNLFSKNLCYVISKIIQEFFILIQEENMKLEDSCSVLYRTFLQKSFWSQMSEYIPWTKSVYCMCIIHFAQLVRCNECI